MSYKSATFPKTVCKALLTPTCKHIVFDSRQVRITIIISFTRLKSKTFFHVQTHSSRCLATAREAALRKQFPALWHDNTKKKWCFPTAGKEGLGDEVETPLQVRVPQLPSRSSLRAWRVFFSTLAVPRIVRFVKILDVKKKVHFRGKRTRYRRRLLVDGARPATAFRPVGSTGIPLINIVFRPAARARRLADAKILSPRNGRRRSAEFRRRPSPTRRPPFHRGKRRA